MHEALRENRDGCLADLYVKCGFSRKKLSQQLGVPEGTLHGWLHKHGLTDRQRGNSMSGNKKPTSESAEREPSADISENEMTLVSAVNPRGTNKLTPEGLLIEHGANPDEWDIKFKANAWDGLAGNGQVTTLHQLTVHATRRVPLDLVMPARTDGPSYFHKALARIQSKTTIPLFSDAHAPYQDKDLEDCSLQWLQKHKPPRAFDLGDLIDLPIPSRHRATFGFEATPQQCIDERYAMDRRRVEASKNTKWKVILGNHDMRIEHALVDKLGRAVASISRAGEAQPIWDLGHLLRYDELGIELVRPEGEYHSVTIEIVPGLFARHGTKAGKHGGAVKAIERRDSSLAQGHDHKGVLHLHVRYDDNGNARLVWSISVMAMCRRDLENTYMEDSDTAQGFTTITEHANGRWHPEQAVYDAASKTLMWRDELYESRL